MKFAIRNPKSAIRNGFTLLELLIAMGILAVGGAMAAALFPAAIKENQRANNSVLGNIICENGLCNVTLALVHDTATPLPIPFLSSTELLEPNPLTPIGLRCLAYPTPAGIKGIPQDQPTYADYTTNPENYPNWMPIPSQSIVVPRTPYGNLVLGKQAIAGDNDYQLAIIAYKRNIPNDPNDDNGLPKLRQVTFSSDEGSLNFTVSGTDDDKYLRLGSPLIHAATGRFATITSRNGTSGTLDKPVAIVKLTNVHGWVVYDPNNPTASPTQRVHISRTPISTP